MGDKQEIICWTLDFGAIRSCVVASSVEQSAQLQPGGPETRVPRTFKDAANANRAFLQRDFRLGTCEQLAP